MQKGRRYLKSPPFLLHTCVRTEKSKGVQGREGRNTDSLERLWGLPGAGYICILGTAHLYMFMGGHLGRRWFKWTRQLFFWPVKFLIRLYNRCAMNEQCLIEAQLLAPKQVSLFSMGLVWYAWMPWFTVFYLSVSLLVISMLYTWHHLLDQRVQIHIWEVGETWVQWLIVWNMDAFQFGDVATTDKISLENGHVGLVREGGGGKGQSTSPVSCLHLNWQRPWLERSNWE